MRDALFHLCRTRNYECYRIICVSGADELMAEARTGKVHCVVLDCAAYLHAYWIYNIRHLYPELNIIISQRMFLYSDRILTEFLGSIWLREYDSILASFPEFSVVDVIYNPVFSTAGSTRMQIGHEKKMDESEFIKVINAWMMNRIRRIFSGCDDCICVIDGVLNGLSVKQICENNHLRYQKVYELRKYIMCFFKIHHFERHFLRSLKFY